MTRGRLRTVPLPAVLFWFVLSAAGVLLALVFLSPLLDNEAQRPHGWRRLVQVFARDAALRRTAVASAAGLTATAFVFFRPPRARAGANRPPSAPPPAVVGA